VVLVIDGRKTWRGRAGAMPFQSRNGHRQADPDCPRRATGTGPPGKPELRQINQRIALRYHLKPSAGKTPDLYRASVRYRRRTRESNVHRFGHQLIYRYSRSTPRLINMLCDRSLLIGYTEDRRKIWPHRDPGVQGHHAETVATVISAPPGRYRRFARWRSF
jgi:hypothetical protein